MPALEHHLLDREVVTTPRLERDPGQQERVPREVHAVRDLHERLAGEVLAGLAERLHRRPRRRHPVHVVHVVDVRGRCVALHDRAVELDRGVVLPLRVGRVLEEDDRHRALDHLVRPALGRELHDVRGRRHCVRERELRLPAELVRVDEALDRELRRREHGVDVRAGRAELRDLRLHVARGDLVRLRGDDLDARALDALLQAVQEVLAVVVVLEEHRDLRRALGPGEVLPEHPALRLVARL